MLHTDKRTRQACIFAFLIIVFLAVCARFTGNGTGLSTVISLLKFITYAGVLIVWYIYVSYRVTHKDIKRYVTASVMLMIFWITVQLSKYRFFQESLVVQHYLWYLYYIPTITLPLLILFSALCVGQRENTPLPKKWKLLYIPMAVLILCVLSNDLHYLVFSFHEDEMYSDIANGYGVMYYAVVTWVAVLLIAALAIMCHRCIVLNIKKYVTLPVVISAVVIAYWLLTETLFSKYRIFLFPETFSFATVAFWESCIQTGLIPSNFGYGSFFNMSRVASQIADNSGKICYRCDNAVELTQEQLRECQSTPVFIDKAHRLSSKQITGGRVYWTDDLTSVNLINEELTEVKTLLSEYNVILQAEAEMKSRRARALEKNRLYDNIASAVSTQLEKLDVLLTGLTSYSPDIKGKYALACVLNVYIKRRSNLELIAENAKYMNAFELESSLRESVEYLNVYGAVCCLLSNVSGELPKETVLLAYNLFEEVTEASLPSLSAMLVNLDVHNSCFTLKISVEDAHKAIAPTWQAQRLSECGAQLSVTEENGTLFVCLKGGVV